MGRTKAFPVYQMSRAPNERVQAVEHPDTGKWWFRHTERRLVWLFGEQRETRHWTPWTCPENQPDQPYLGMKKLDGKFAMLPVAS